ncbi:MAG TPA: DUF5916 domain-containing protein [Longimicrobiales bacterium]|nr:DUF5916 domain-containing protein [Longimicrobiales bacterium]
MQTALRSRLILFLLFAPTMAVAQQQQHTERPRVRAIARSAPVNLDGVLDEAVWSGAPAASNFIQYDPKNGEPALNKTEVRFLFDDDALYIGARMTDEKGRAGVRTRLSRRDNINGGDNLQFVFDTYHDHAGRTVFTVNPSGVKQDAGQASPNADSGWDPVWDVATKINEDGWSAEFRIPWAQLRFPKDSLQTWGVQIWRYEERTNETSHWSPWGKNDPGGPAYFGHIEGLQVGHKRGGIEVLPYVVGKAAYQQPTDPGSPFYDASDLGWRAGGDVKALLTSTLTLDATINPDFGQVEVDPAVVNLSAFETFFQERRPFFVSGNGVFGFGGFNCFYCSNVSSMTLFYSRRIGRNPQGFVSGPADHTQMPDNTTILGAAKITGRLRGGMQIGLLNALTASEKANAVDGAGKSFSEEVEPMTNYLVGRAKKTYKNGDYTFGVIGTSTLRKFNNPVLETLVPSHSEAAGVDWNMNWKKRTYSFMGNLAFSDVNGDTAAIRRIQRSSARYWQRPDRVSGSNGLFTDTYDAKLTAIRGYGGYARIAKDAGEWRGETSVNFRSPGFEVNDLAFNTRSDYTWMNTNLVRAFSKPTKYYRRMDFTLGGQQQYNFEGDLTDRQLHVWAGTETPFFWSFTGSAQYRPETYDDRQTRGGPVVRRPAQRYAFFNINTDFRKPVVVSVGPFWGRNSEGGRNFSLSGNIEFKPLTNLTVEFSPSYSHDIGTAQYVAKFTDPSATNFFNQRVVFAGIEQKSLSFDTRVNTTFTPTLTLEVVLQPFVSTGDYSNFKEYVAPRSVEKRNFDATQLTAQRDAAGRETGYVLDPDRNATTQNFTFGNPDFNFRSLRGNAVLRWEYRPGSTLFLVWQQSRSGSEAYGDFEFSRDTNAIFNARPDNIFLVKVSYWFQR